MIRSIIFDFDGLILETEGPIFQSWQELYQDYGREITIDEWGKIIGTAENTFDPLAALEEQLGQILDRASLVPRRRQRESDLIAIQPVLPGVEDYLKSARRLGLKIGLASSSSCEWVTGHLERLGLLDYFDCIKTADDVQFTKPDPELYQAVLEELGLRPQEAIVFEDSPNGILAAKQAGLICIAVPNALTRQLSTNHADFRLDSLEEMPLDELICRVENEVRRHDNALGS